jgi:hypothetical protein
MSRTTRRAMIRRWRMRILTLMIFARTITMGNKIEFTEDTHTYTLNGVKVPGVTTVIAETVGHGWSAADWYLQRGRAIHACARFIAEGKKFKHDERLTGYVKAIEKFFLEVKPVLDFGFGETIVHSAVMKYCGMIDLPCRIGRDNSIVDYKHSIDKIRIALQLGGYSGAALETLGTVFNSGYGVQIRENGTYQMTDKIDLRRPKSEFFALRTTYAVKERCGELSSQKEKKGNE